jgi:hypothetical protein
MSTAPMPIPSDIAKMCVDSCQFSVSFFFDHNLVILPALALLCAQARDVLAFRRLTFSTVRAALCSLNELGIIWRPLRPGLYESSLVTSTIPTIDPRLQTCTPTTSQMTNVS